MWSKKLWLDFFKSCPSPTFVHQKLSVSSPGMATIWWEYNPIWGYMEDLRWNGDSQFNGIMIYIGCFDCIFGRILACGAIYFVFSWIWDVIMLKNQFLWIHWAMAKYRKMSFIDAGHCIRNISHFVVFIETFLLNSHQFPTSSFLLTSFDRDLGKKRGSNFYWRARSKSVKSKMEPFFDFDWR